MNLFQFSCNRKIITRFTLPRRVNLPPDCHLRRFFRTFEKMTRRRVSTNFSSKVNFRKFHARDGAIREKEI